MIEKSGSGAISSEAEWFGYIPVSFFLSRKAFL